VPHWAVVYVVVRLVRRPPEALRKMHPLEKNAIRRPYQLTRWALCVLEPGGQVQLRQGSRRTISSGLRAQQCNSGSVRVLLLLLLPPPPPAPPLPCVAHGSQQSHGWAPPQQTQLAVTVTPAKGKTRTRADSQQSMANRAKRHARAGSHHNVTTL